MFHVSSVHFSWLLQDIHYFPSLLFMPAMVVLAVSFQKAIETQMSTKDTAPTTVCQCWGREAASAVPNAWRLHSSTRPISAADHFFQSPPLQLMARAYGGWARGRAIGRVESSRASMSHRPGWECQLCCYLLQSL